MLQLRRTLLGGRWPAVDRQIARLTVTGAQRSALEHGRRPPSPAQPHHERQAGRSLSGQPAAATRRGARIGRPSRLETNLLWRGSAYHRVPHAGRARVSAGVPQRISHRRRA